MGKGAAKHKSKKRAHNAEEEGTPGAGDDTEEENSEDQGPVGLKTCSYGA
jgi:hypothetical protein